jgi:hypothetical protein
MCALHFHDEGRALGSRVGGDRTPLKTVCARPLQRACSNELDGVGFTLLLRDSTAASGR